MEVSNASNQPVISSAQSSTTPTTTTISTTSKSGGGGGGKKRNLTLDLKHSTTSSIIVSAASTLTVPSTSGLLDLRSSPGFVLTSPDVQMLQLASPELEKFIIQGLMGQNTPTPTQIVFPKNVTEEQESYAKGFVDALNALHRSGMAYNVNPNTGNVAAFPINSVTGQNIFPQFFTMPQMAQQVQPMQIQMTTQPVTGHQMVQLQMPAPMNVPKMEFNSPSVSPAPSDPQTVPSERGSTRSTNSSSGTSPINMENQSKMKVERKRERNRVAAAKCRMRKLERIAQLEERVKELKDQNTELANSRQQTRIDSANLRQELLTHLSAGCPLTIPQNLLQSIQQHQQDTE